MVDQLNLEVDAMNRLWDNDFFIILHVRNCFPQINLLKPAGNCYYHLPIFCVKFHLILVSRFLISIAYREGHFVPFSISISICILITADPFPLVRH
jgi:hypothetical protein